MLISIFVLIFSLSSAGEIPPDCQNQVHDYGDGKGASEVSFSCLQEYKKLALPQAWKSSFSDSFVVGAKDLVIVHKEQSTSVIAGSNTLLREVTALAVDIYNDEVVVYDRNTDYVLFFSRTVTGNVSPYRILSDARLKGTVDLAVDGIKGELYVLNRDNREILVFSRMANINGRKGRRNLNLLRKITAIPQDVHSLGLASSYQEFYLLINDKLSVYPLNKADIQNPLRVIRYSAEQGVYGSLSYLHDRDELLVLQRGRRMYYPRERR